MAWMCPQCGSPNGDTIPTCAVCGAVAPQASAAGARPGAYGAPPGAAGGWGAPAAGGYGTPAGQPPGGYGAPAGQPPGGYGAPAGQPPGGFGAPPGQPPGGGQWGQPPAAGPGQWGPGAPMGAPQYAGPAASKDDGSKMMWGCGIAGCLGVLVLIGIIIVVLFVVRDSAGSSGGDDDDRRGKSGSDDDGRRSPSGRLADNVPKRIGSYEASSARPLQVPGAVDAIVVVYRSGSSEIEHAIAIFPDTDAAQQHLIDSTGRVDADTSVDPQIVRIKNPDGEEIGLGSHFESNPEWLVYRIGKMMAILKGPRGEVVPFFQKLP